MVDRIFPLPIGFPIVDPKTGAATQAFAQYWQQMFGERLTNEISSGRLFGRRTAGSGVIEELTISQALDLIGDAEHGDILYRGADEWARLPAGSSGQFLKTLGPGSDPAWTGTGGGHSYEAYSSNNVPAVADTTWLNQGTSTIADGTGGVILTPQSDGGVHGRLMASPSAPFDVYARWRTTMHSAIGITGQAYIISEIFLLDGSNDGTAVELLELRSTSGSDELNLYYIQVYEINAGALGSQIGTFYRALHPYRWCRLGNDGSNITVYTSEDGVNWIVTPLTWAIATYSGAITQIGYGARANTPTAVVFSQFGTDAPVL